MSDFLNDRDYLTAGCLGLSVRRYLYRGADTTSDLGHALLFIAAGVTHTIGYYRARFFRSAQRIGDIDKNISSLLRVVRLHR